MALLFMMTQVLPLFYVSLSFGPRERDAQLGFGATLRMLSLIILDSGVSHSLFMGGMVQFAL